MRNLFNLDLNYQRMETEIPQGFHDFFNKKRKRFTTAIPQNDFVENGNDVDFDEGDYISTVQFEIHDGLNRDGMVMKKTHKPRSHKVVITEEKMSDAFRELQLDRNSKEEQSDLKLYITDELRSSIDKFKNEDDKLKQKFLDLNKEYQIDHSKHMQIVPWIPNEINEKNLSESEAKNEDKSSTSSDGSMDSFENFNQDSSDILNKYKVEIPSEKKNFLKRKHSEVNSLIIEELKATEDSPSNITNQYLVELPVEESQANAQSSPRTQNFTFENEPAAQQPHVLITEFIEQPLVTSFKDFKNRRLIDEEEMDL